MQKIRHVYPDGSQYDGEIKDGKRHGKGIMIRADGARYEGEWQNNKPHGQGTATVPDGRKREGEWREGKYVGEAQTNNDIDKNQQELNEGNAEPRYWIRNENQHNNKIQTPNYSKVEARKEEVRKVEVSSEVFSKKDKTRTIRETRSTCQGCGNVWHYGKSVERTETYKAMMCCTGCVPALFTIKNLNKCPKCGSEASKKETVEHQVP